MSGHIPIHNTFDQDTVEGSPNTVQPVRVKNCVFRAHQRQKDIKISSKSRLSKDETSWLETSYSYYSLAQLATLLSDLTPKLD